MYIFLVGMIIWLVSFQVVPTFLNEKEDINCRKI